MTYFPLLCDYAERTKLSLQPNTFSDTLFIFGKRRARAHLPELISLSDITNQDRRATETSLGDAYKTRHERKKK